MEMGTRHTLAVLALSSLMSALPYQFDFGTDGAWTLSPSFAAAKGGDDDHDDAPDDSDGRDDRDDDRDDDRGDDDRGGDRDDDRSDDDYDDSRDDDRSGHHDDDRDDGRRGRGRGSDDGVYRRTGTASNDGAAGRTTRGGGIVRKLEVSGDNIEITYTDGWKEEIEGGRYELKDDRNRTVIERPAKASDRERLFAVTR